MSATSHVVQSGPLANIQALRGIAAMMVFCIHVLSTGDAMGVDKLKVVFSAYGPAGVDVFFVLSGFIVSLVAAKNSKSTDVRGRLHTAFSFFLRRAARIYPTYWIAFACATWLGATHSVYLAPSWLPPSPLWQQFLLLTKDNSQIMAAWSLSFEMYFYAVVTLIIFVWPTQIFAALGCWLGLMAVAQVIALVLAPSLLDGVLLSPLIFEFGLGVWVAYLFSQGRGRRRAHALLVIGVLTFLVCAPLNLRYGGYAPLWRCALLGIPSAIILHALLRLEVDHKQIFGPIWVRLGDASYSIYLWHQLLLHTQLRITEHLGWMDLLPRPLVLVLWGLLAFSLSFRLHTWLERPLTRYLQRRLA